MYFISRARLICAPRAILENVWLGKRILLLEKNGLICKFHERQCILVKFCKMNLFFMLLLK